MSAMYSGVGGGGQADVPLKVAGTSLARLIIALGGRALVEVNDGGLQLGKVGRVDFT